MPWKRLPPLLVTLSSNIGFLLRPSLSTSTTPPAPCVRGPMQWPIMGVRPPSPSNLVGPLRSLSLRQTLDKGRPLPSLVLSPPSSPIPPPAHLRFLRWLNSAVLLCGRKTERPRKIGPLRIHRRSVGLVVVLLQWGQKGSWKQ